MGFLLAHQYAIRAVFATAELLVWQECSWFHHIANDCKCAVWLFNTCSDVNGRALVHAVESVVIEWTHQIREVLKKDSAQPLLEGLNPVPYVEMEFWKVKAQNLECIYDQVSSVWCRLQIVTFASTLSVADVKSKLTSLHSVSYCIGSLLVLSTTLSTIRYDRGV